ncbi:mucin-associated surface protein (MASP) [Trypanosoma cruzi]|nr:mucin-associated surface protein (MASP) [Trypanosoma cruzi]
MRAAAAGGCCVSCLLLLSLCVDGALVCAEGYTQVTGMMAMMMTGRVLLVCALCVLWCVAVFGVAADDAGGGDGSAGEYWGSWWITQLRRECAEEVGRRTGGRANASAVEECVRRGMDGVRAVMDGRRRWGPQQFAVAAAAGSGEVSDPESSSQDQSGAAAGLKEKAPLGPALEPQPAKLDKAPGDGDALQTPAEIPGLPETRSEKMFK